MKTFATAREAKEFLVSKIVGESQREGVLLSETEKKMMYFSETAWTLPDITDVNDAFDRNYDQADYECKIGALVKGFRAHARREDTRTYEQWLEAVQTISQEDHYLLVLIAAGDEPDILSRARLLRLLTLALIAACFLLAIGYFLLRR